MNLSSVLLYEKQYDKEKYPVEPYKELVVQQIHHEKRFEIMGAWKTGCLEESSRNIIYRSASSRSYSFTERWNNDAPVGKKSWEYISRHENIFRSIIPNEFPLSSPQVFSELLKLKGIGFVYAAFVLHCLNPEVFPLFDQHVMRAFRAVIKDQSNLEKTENLASWRWDDYVAYKQFFERALNETGLIYMRLDRALWTYGKHIKTNRSHSQIYYTNTDHPEENTIESTKCSDDNDWFCARTLGGKEKEFFWTIDDNNLRIKRSLKNGIDHRSFTFQELDIIQSHMESNTWLPLANNVAKLGNGTEQWGVGRIITDILQRNPSDGQLASHISAIFVKSGVWECNGKIRGMMFRKTETDWRDRLKK